MAVTMQSPAHPDSAEIIRRAIIKDLTQQAYQKVVDRNSFILANDVNAFYSEDKNHVSLIEAKKHNICIAQSIKRLHPDEHKKFNKIFMCADNVSYTYSPKHKKTHVQGYFCEHRLCPVCNYYRSRALFSRVYTYVKDHPDRKFLFLTLTVPNVPGDQLRDTVLKMNRAFGKMFPITSPNSKTFKMFSSYLRRTEVTYNLNSESLAYKTFHPHMHIILECKPEYSPRSDCYYHTSEIRADWQKYMEDDRILYVKVSEIKSKPGANYDGGIAGAVAECCKYPFKMSKLLFHPSHQDDLDEYISWVETLKGVRFESAAGEIRPILHFVQLSDENNPDIPDENIVSRDQIEQDPESVHLELKWIPVLSIYQLHACLNNQYMCSEAEYFRLRNNPLYSWDFLIRSRPK